MARKALRVYWKDGSAEEIVIPDGSYSVPGDGLFPIGYVHFKQDSDERSADWAVDLRESRSWSVVNVA